MLTQQVGWHAGLVCSEFTRVQSPIVAPPRHHEAITEMLTKRHGRKMEVSPFTVEQMKKKTGEIHDHEEQTSPNPK